MARRPYKRVRAEVASEQLSQLCETFRTMRSERELTLIELHEKTGMDVSHISKIERGEMPNVTVFTLERLALAFNYCLTLGLKPGADQC